MLTREEKSSSSCPYIAVFPLLSCVAVNSHGLFRNGSLDRKLEAL